MTKHGIQSQLPSQCTNNIYEAASLIAAETYLYVCLVEAIEDKSKVGLVLYDSRADWKLKADTIVVANQILIRVSAFAGELSDRPRIEAKREVIERVRKVNTMESAHWGNAQLAQMNTFEIVRTEEEQQVINGVRLFSLRAINELLKSIYERAGIENRYYFGGD